MLFHPLLYVFKRFFFALPAFYIYPFAGFLLFVILKKELDFIQNLFRYIGNIIVLAIFLINFRSWYGDNFGIHSCFVCHLKHSDGFGCNNNTNGYRFAAKHQDINWISVSCQCIWNKSVVKRIIHVGKKKTINKNSTRFFIEFIFYAYSLRNFDKNIYLFGWIFPDRYFCNI